LNLLKAIFIAVVVIIPEIKKAMSKYKARKKLYASKDAGDEAN
jgi:hypothetical protein